MKPHLHVPAAPPSCRSVRIQAELFPPAPRPAPPQAHLLPQRLSGGERRAGCHKPAVAHLALVQVVGADAVHKEAGVLADVLPGSREEASVLV